MDTSSMMYQFKSAFSEWLIYTFNKEAIAIFVLLVLVFFIFAAIFAGWAIKNGEFSDVEAAKFEMMEL